MAPGSLRRHVTAALAAQLLLVGCSPAATTAPTTPPGAATLAAATAAPTPTPAETTVGTPQLTSVDTNLVPGTYGLGDFGVDIEVTVPSGWVGNASPGLAGVVSGMGTDRETMLLFWRISAIFENPCALNPPAPTGELTVHEIADGVLGLPDVDVQEASTVELDSYDARYIEMLAPINTECNPYRMWLGPDRACRCMYPEAQHFRLWVLEVDGVPFMIESLDTPAGETAAGTSPEVLGELDAMVETIDIKPTS